MTNSSQKGLKQKRILVVDDDSLIRQTLKTLLGKEDYLVDTAADGESAFTQVGRNRPDLILLDIRMPGEDGLRLMQRIHAEYTIPVILLTGKAETLDKVLGLELGAVDYITKPFDVRELVARVRTRLRPDTPRPGEGKSRLAFEGWRIDLDAYQFYSPAGELVNLTSHEFKLLAVFIKNRGRVLSRSQLLDLTVARDWDPIDRSIDVLVGKLRKIIESNPKQPRIIKTIRGVGYMFAPELTDWQKR